MLYTQEKAEIELISEKEIEYIKNVWKNDFGWEENEEDLKPEFPEYEGALVLNPDYSINVEDEFGIVTTIPNLTIYADGVDKATGETVVLPPIETKKMNPPKRKQSKMTKKEAIAEHNRPKAKTINVNPSIKEQYEVFYIERDWGGDEVSIMEHLERSSRKAKQFIPYYWLPAYSMESRVDWKSIRERNHLVYWNKVVFIVCLPTIKTRQEAIQFVDWYISKGEQEVRVYEPSKEQEEQQLMSQYGHYLDLSPQQAKVEILRNTEDPDYLPLAVKKHANVTDEEMTIARVMRYSSNNPEKVNHYCKGEIWERVAQLLIEGLEKHKARKLLITRGYNPKVLPKHLTMKIGLGNLFLKKANRFLGEGIAGNELIKRFPISFWIKGMTPEQAQSFIVETGYQVNEINDDILSCANLSTEKLMIIENLKNEGCSSEFLLGNADKIEKILQKMISMQFSREPQQLAFSL